MRRLLVALCAGLVAVCTAASAAHRGPCTSNGCGPAGWRGKLVPEKFAGCTFTPACNSHDICYGQCTDCGPHHGKQMCIAKVQRAALKHDCDVALEKDIATLNNGDWLCRAFAKVYYIAVAGFGDQYFGATPPSENAIAHAKEDMTALTQYAGFTDRAATERRLSQVQDAAVLLRRADQGFENQFAVVPPPAPGAEPTLSFQSRAPVGPLVVPRDGVRFEQKQTLNGVDVSRMRLRGQAPNLEQIIRTTPGVPIENLERTLRFERVQ